MLDTPFHIKTHINCMYIYHALIAMGIRAFEVNASDGAFIYSPHSNSFTSLPVDVISPTYSKELTLADLEAEMSSSAKERYIKAISHLPPKLP